MQLAKPLENEVDGNFLKTQMMKALRGDLVKTYKRVC